jgi:hypothetical protein
MMLTRFRGLLPLLCGAWVIFVCVGLAPAAVVSPEIAENGAVIVTAETAEVREGPAPSFAVITVVANGEIFVKEGRTGAWYYIRINDGTFGWISGRAISRYQEDEAPSTYVEPRDGPTESGDYQPYPSSPYYPYYPGSYYGYIYDYPFYYWGQPYFSSDYYYYDNYRHRGYSREHESGYPRNRDYPRYRDDGRHGGGDTHRYYNVGPRVAPVPRPPGPAPRSYRPSPRPAVPRIRPALPRR